MQETPKQEPEKLQLTPEQIEEMKKKVERAEMLGNLFDGTGKLDPILGLFSVPGDTASAAASAYIIYEAQQMGVPNTELAKMLGRSLLDYAGGSIPVVGDLFDFAYKDKEANAAAMRKHFENIRNGVEDLELQRMQLAKQDREAEEDVLEGNQAA